MSSLDVDFENNYVKVMAPIKQAFVAPGPTLPVETTQIKAAIDYGVQPQHIWQDLKDCIEALREGDELAVYRMAALAPAGKKFTKTRRDRMTDAAVRIFQKGATIYEIDRKRAASGMTALTIMFNDAVAELQSRRVYREPRQAGRPPQRQWTEADRKLARAIWRQAHRDNKARVATVVEAVGEPFNYNMGNRLFGAPSKPK